MIPAPVRPAKGRAGIKSTELCDRSAPFCALTSGYGDLPHVPIPGDDPLVRRQIAGSHRTARVEFVGADPDLCAQTILASIRKARGRVDDDAGGVDALHKVVNVSRRRAEDRVGVVAAMRVD